jgi:hypothetical protein
MQDILKKTEQEISFYFNRFLNGRKAKTILFYPEYPHKRTIVYKILKHLKYNITANPAHHFDLAFFWIDSTFRKEEPVLKRINNQKVINIKCRDISKAKISEVFEEVFGYGMNINPLVYSGECVKKNNLNAKHDGIIVQCPVENTEEGFIYQKVINNIINDELVMDLRIPVLRGKIPFIYLKYKKLVDRFTNDLYKSEIASVNEYLTMDEVKNISEFCLRLGLDYGELDVLRNKDDRKIYIVDVNYTPWGPPAKLTEVEDRMAVKRMSEAFKNIYFI